MKKIINGFFIGTAAGVIDVIPMILQKLTWDANISAFVFWTVTGVLISATDIKVKPFLKGIIVAFLVLLPCAVLIGRKEPASLIPVTIMTLLLGALTGYFVNKINGGNNGNN